MYPNKLVKISDKFYLLGNNLAKNGEYSITVSDTLMKYDDKKLFLWNHGCAKIIASTPNSFLSSEDGIQVLSNTESIIEYKGNLVTLDELYELSNPKGDKFPMTFKTEKELIQHLTKLLEFSRNNSYSSAELTAINFLQNLPVINEWIVELEELTEWNINEPGIGILKVINK